MPSKTFPLLSLPLALAVLSLACTSNGEDYPSGDDNEDGDSGDSAGDDGSTGDAGDSGDGPDDAGESGGDGGSDDADDGTGDEGDDSSDGGVDADDESDAGEEEDDSGDDGEETDDGAEDSGSGDGVDDESSDGADDSASSEGGEEDDSGDGGGDGDDWVEDVVISVHEEVNTVLVVTWNQVMEADEVWLEFSYDGSDVMTSRPQPGNAGAHQDVVLGVPGETDVTVRIVSSSGGTDYKTSDHQGTTDPLPAGMPEPTVVSYDPAGASPEPWMFGSVEDSSCSDGSCQYYQNIFWLYIMDRQGQIVWYYADPSSNISSAFQRVALDGEYIVVDKGRLNDTSVVMMTLDHEYFEEISITVDDCIDVTDEGLILHNDGGNLLETNPDSGETRQIWNCSEVITSGGCYSNTVNWNPLDDTVLMSFPYANTVVEIARESGDLVGAYGDQGDYEFDPSSLGFEFNHFPTITPDGTLLVSSHMPGYPTNNPVAGQHAFMEFEIDRASNVLTSVWLYQEGPEWPRAKGMAIRLANGNTLANYGTGGTIREITPDMDTVFHVKFDVTPDEGADEEDFYNKMVNHNVFVDDLYSLNGGPD